MVDAKSVSPGLNFPPLSPCLDESLSSLFFVISFSSLCFSMSLAFFSVLEDGRLLRTTWESVVSLGTVFKTGDGFDWTGITGGRSSEAMIG